MTIADQGVSARPGTDRLVFLTTDAGYLVPTLVAALQVARQATAIADVAVFLVGMDADVELALRADFPELQFSLLESECFVLPSDAVYNETHVPRSALARLVAGPLIAPQYKHLVYLDGDIQIVGDITPLLRFNVPAGKLLAAPDVAEMVWPERGAFARGFRDYIRKLGISRPEAYFNSGVLAAQRETWLSLGQAAFAYMSAHSDLCRFHDQSSLNKVVGSDRLLLSPRYNFISVYHGLVPNPLTFAAILHFSGGEKPWRDSGGQREGSTRKPYTDLVAQHPILAPYWKITAGRGGGAPRSSRVLTWRSALARLRSFSRRVRFRRRLARSVFSLR